eukprot:PhF_6_TR5489/c0_g1_i1/m.7751
MQLQQAHQLLAQANPHQTVTVPHSPTQPLNQTSSTTLSTSPSQNAFTTLSSQNSSSSQAMSPKTPRSANTSEGGTAAAVVAIVEVPLDEVTVLVHDADVHELPSEVSLTMVHTVVHLSETATMYSISVVNKTTNAPYQSVRVRFSQCEPVFQVLKDIGKTSLPEIPGKKPLQAMIRGFTKAFIEERRIEMEKFLQVAIKDRFLSRHPKLLDMLKIKEAAVGVGGVGGGAHGASSNVTIEMCKQWKSGPLLGRGTSGSVYIGLLPNSLFVAVKVISSKEPTGCEEISEELKFLETLDHPNIVKYYGTNKNEKESQFEIFTEYVEGGSVASVVKKFGALHISVIRNYSKQILSALKYLHSKGIAHRDIKGDNLLVDKNGEVKLTDFGCSKTLTGDKRASLAGTPLWMAPEVISGEETSVKSDIWSVGCVVLEMLGKEPWKNQPGENAFSIMYRIQCSTGMPDGLPPESQIGAVLYDFLRKCFDRDPVGRWSAEQLLEHEFFHEKQIAPGVTL